MLLPGIGVEDVADQGPECELGLEHVLEERGALSALARLIGGLEKRVRFTCTSSVPTWAMLRASAKPNASPEPEERRFCSAPAGSGSVSDCSGSANCSASGAAAEGGILAQAERGRAPGGSWG